MEAKSSQDQSEGCMGFRTPAQDKIQPKKRKRLSLKLRKDKRGRARVDIGSAFERWCAVKATKGLNSHAEMALCLLDEMKRLPSDSPGASDKKIKISQSELQELIQQEICSALKSNETKLQELKDTTENVDYASSIQKLEAKINRLTRRAEAALAHIESTQEKRPPPCVNVKDVRIHSDDETVKTSPQSDKKSRDCLDIRGQFVQIMEATKKEFDRLRADNEDLTASMADLTEPSPPVLSHCGSSEPEKEVEGKAELKDEQQTTVKDTKFIKFEKPEAETKVESLPNHTETTQDKISYPPLPSMTIPSTLSKEAASYNIPQRPEVHLALIREPAGLSVLWKEKKEDPLAPPMDSYSIFMAIEKVKGSGVFPKWMLLGEVKAFPLPMCVMIKKYKPGHKLCVAVIGKDTFGRSGPYSKVVTAAIPE